MSLQRMTHSGVLSAYRERTMPRRRGRAGSVAEVHGYHPGAAVSRF